MALFSIDDDTCREGESAKQNMTTLAMSVDLKTEKLGHTYGIFDINVNGNSNAKWKTWCNVETITNGP